MPPASTKKYLRCVDGFVLPDRTVVKAGQSVLATDRVVKGREHLFVPLDGDDVVEQATAAPNERRVTPGTGPARDTVIDPSKPRRRGAARKGR